MFPQHHKNTDIELRRDVLLVTQVALLGEISAAVRGVTVAWSKDEISIRAVFDGPVSESDKESMECVGSEVIASFPEHTINVEVVRCDMPASIDMLFLMAWVYVRKEV